MEKINRMKIMKRISQLVIVLLIASTWASSFCVYGDSPAVKIGAVPYNSLADALAAANNGDVITLLSDLTESVEFNPNKNVEIDGQFHTITGVSPTAINLNSQGDASPYVFKLKNITLVGGNATGGTSVGLYADAPGHSICSSGTVRCIGGYGNESIGLWLNRSKATITEAIGGEADFQSAGVLCGNGIANVYRAEGGNADKSFGVVCLEGYVNVNEAIGGDARSMSIGANLGGGVINVNRAVGGNASHKGESCGSFGIVNGGGTVNAYEAGFGETGTNKTNVFFGYSQWYAEASPPVGAPGTVNISHYQPSLTPYIKDIPTSTFNSSDVGRIKLNIGVGSSCVLDAITVGPATNVGVLPEVENNDTYTKMWYSDPDKTTLLSYSVDPYTGYSIYTADGNSKLYSGFYNKDDKIIGITTPGPITAPQNGVVSSAAALGLPETVTIAASSSGALAAKVNWDVTSSGYDKTKKEEQTFTVNGTVVLPNGLENPDGISLSTSITVTVPAYVPPTNADNMASVTSTSAIVAGAVYQMNQSEVHSEADVKSAIETILSGLNLDGASAAVNKIDYTPAIAGTVGTPAGVDGVYHFTVTLSKGIDAALATTTTGSLTMNIHATVCPLLGISTASLPAGSIGEPYSMTLTAEYGVPPYSWNVTGLAPGLSINSAAGTISGTTNETGSYSVSATVTDAVGSTYLKVFPLTIYDTLSTELTGLSVSTGTLSPAFNKNIVAYSLNAAGNVSSIDIIAQTADTGAALTIDGQTAVSGITHRVALKQGANLIPLVVSSPDGASQKSYVISVNGTVNNADLASLSVNGYALTPVFEKTQKNYTLTVGNSTNSLTLAAITEDAKALLIINGSVVKNGIEKEVSLNEGENVIEIMAVAQDASNQTYRIRVIREGLLSISTSGLPRGVAGAHYDAILTALGGKAPYTWTATGLPSGINLSTNGAISGMAAEGESVVSIVVTDANNTTVTKQLSLKFNLGCGNGGYRIIPDHDAAYTSSLTADGLPVMTVGAGVSGLKYFFANIEPVKGHSGKEVAVFVHMRGGQQIGFSFIKADLDTLNTVGASFNVKSGDIIKLYIVDDLSNSTSDSPVLL